jgi:hypothetical protein
MGDGRRKFMNFETMKINGEADFEFGWFVIGWKMTTGCCFESVITNTFIKQLVYVFVKQSKAEDCVEIQQREVLEFKESRHN